MQSVTPLPICSLFRRSIRITAGPARIQGGVRRGWLWGAGLALLSGCGSLPSLTGPIDQTPSQSTPGQTGLVAPTQPGPALPVEPIEPATPMVPANPVADALGSIARLEAGRTTGGGYLQTLLRHQDPRVREQATRALGRLPKDRFGRNVSGPLQVALVDPAANVRQAAAFSLGIRGDRSVAEALLEAVDDEDASVRAQVYLAMARLGASGCAEALLEGFQDPDRTAQEAAAEAFAHWPKDEAPGPDGWDGVRVALAPLTANAPTEVRWRALFAYARRAELRSDPTPLITACMREDAIVWERLFATLGLSRWMNDHKEGLSLPRAEQTPELLEQTPKVVMALAQRALDPDERVVVEALRGFASVNRGLPGEIVSRVLQHGSPHVRAAAVAALGTNNAGGEPEEMMGHDPSSMVRRAAFAMHIQRRPADAIARIREWGRSRDYRQRRSAAQVAHHVGTDDARSVVMGLADDKHPQVAIEAIGQFQHFQDATTRARLHAYCQHEDNGRKLAAVMALKEFAPEAQDLPFLIEAYTGAHGDGALEVCFNALRVAAEIEGEDASEFLKAGLLHGDPFVLQVAQEALTQRGKSIPELETPALAGPTELAPVWDRDRPNPKVSVQTNRGTMVFELFPEVAPVHVYNLLQLADRGHYDGLRWHRVVSDFVIQGGCYRGDGNGGGTWRGFGDAVGQEFTELTYGEGALGMPRNENPDSGGSQIFITHRPTPHLDGRYTLFGQLTSGRDVLHRIEEGDRILSLKRL